MRVLHCLNLDTIGGVEQLFRLLLENGAREGQEDHLLVTGDRIHPLLAPGCTQHAASVRHTKYALGFKLPKWPASLRSRHLTRAVRAARPDVGVIWNRFGDFSALRALRARATRVAYYEHGSAWLARKDGANEKFLGGMEAVFCASVAARRLLELRWNYRGPSHVVLNCLRPDLIPAGPPSRTLPAGGPFRLGVAARFVAVKGLGTALHAASLLKQRGLAVELHLAGDGPQRAALEATAGRLGIHPAVKFRGVLRDMAEFYRQMHLLLVPSVREPFGMVVLEAAAHGCPAIVSRVDGLPEAVAEGATGICVTPTIPTGDSVDLNLGGELPEFVYDPAADRLVEPKFIEPVKFATAIEALLGDPVRYVKMSAAAAKRAREQFSVTMYVQQLRAAIASAGKE